MDSWDKDFCELMGWSYWVQPIGAMDAYQTGDRVGFDGKLWECVYSFNVCSPTSFGWEMVDDGRSN